MNQQKSNNLIKDLYIQDVDQLIEERKYIFIKKAWLNVRGNRSKIMNLLYEEFPEKNWKGKIMGKLAWEYINDLNESYHTDKRTSGAVRYRTRVIKSQGGEFCSMCGEDKDSLQVDHIKRVNDGGSDSISNLHLLCNACHSGKTNLENESIGILLKKKENEEMIDNGLFYYLLYNNSKLSGPRRYGKCTCGKIVPDCKITIVPKRMKTLFSLDNYKLTCNHCN